MLKSQKNRGGYTECNKCHKEIEYGEEYFWETNTGKIYHEKCVK
jgi:hypothetical protein